VRKGKYKFIILGAGVSGMSTAYTLSRVYPREVLLLEKEGEVGGLCRTITANNNRYDLGSHRIHPNSAERSLGFMRDICAPTIIKNKRSGKLRLKRSYIDYPITSIQMIAGIGLVESFLCALSLIKSWIEYNFLRRNRDGKILDYRSYLIRKAGLRGYRIFYEPYARKV
jgi:protoporphyrinogen oxidase